MKTINNTVLIIDNYDSFTYNLVHLINECGFEVEVWRNDKFELDAVEQFHKIVLSPGPGIPEEAGKLLAVIRKYAPTKSIFGVCLGQQAIYEAFNGELVNLEEPLHGIATEIVVKDTQDPLFKSIPPRFKIGRYHSWVVNKNDIPSCFKIIAEDINEEIMALRHRTYDVSGVQFHPESVLTEYGKTLMTNWLNSDF